jgi:hypothetical protein
MTLMQVTPMYRCTDRHNGYLISLTYIFSEYRILGPLKAWPSSNIWEQTLQIKIVFMKRLRAD